MKLKKHIINRKTVFVNNKKNKKLLEYVDEQNIDYLIYPYDNIKYKDCLLISFSGKNVNLLSIYKLNWFPGFIFLFCDRQNAWYDNKINKYELIIKKFLKNNNCKKIIIMGDSMGGYASLLFSTLIPNSICIAFAPQTHYIYDKIIFHDKVYKKSRTYTIYDNDNKQLTRNIVDLQLIINNSNNGSKRYIINGNSECDRKDKYLFTADLVESYHLIDCPNTKLLIIPINFHGMFKFIEFNSLQKFIIENFFTLFNNMNVGGKLLVNNLVIKDYTLFNLK